MKKELVKNLNQYLANSSVLYIKLHNLHWNIIGSDFKTIHEYLETLYDSLPSVIDDVAEMLKINGETPLASLKDYLSVATVAELPSVEVRSAEALSTVKNDMILMKQQAETIRTMASEEDLYSIVSLMEEHLGSYNKTIWFLNAMER